MDFEIEPETLDAEVPNLILQPLVENAIRQEGVGLSTTRERLEHPPPLRRLRRLGIVAAL